MNKNSISEEHSTVVLDVDEMVWVDWISPAGWGEVSIEQLIEDKCVLTPWYITPNIYHLPTRLRTSYLAAV